MLTYVFAYQAAGPRGTRRPRFLSRLFRNVVLFRGQPEDRPLVPKIGRLKIDRPVIEPKRWFWISSSSNHFHFLNEHQCPNGSGSLLLNTTAFLRASSIGLLIHSWRYGLLFGAPALDDVTESFGHSSRILTIM
jgi:hypothetical protein